jgi:hypothetical protein
MIWQAIDIVYLMACHNCGNNMLTYADPVANAIAMRTVGKCFNHTAFAAPLCRNCSCSAV